MTMSYPAGHPRSHPLSRDIPVEVERAALLIVDVQNYNCRSEGGEYAHLSDADQAASVRVLLPNPRRAHVAELGAVARDVPCCGHRGCVHADRET